MLERFPNQTASELEAIQACIKHFLNKPTNEIGGGNIEKLKTILEHIEHDINHKKLSDEKVVCEYCNGTGYANDSRFSFDEGKCIATAKVI